MNKLIYIVLFFTASIQAQEVLTFDKTKADVIRGEYGEYSALDPIALPDGFYMLPSSCLQDDEFSSAYSLINDNDGVNEVLDLPEIGELVTMGVLYKYPESSIGLIKCVQTHNRTIYPPSETPALFSFFRENSDTLTWIPNEYVYLDWKRVYQGLSYTCIQEHMTLSTWTPDVVPAIWQTDELPCSDFVQPTGGHDAYNIGDCVIFNGNTYESLINANVWSPLTYPQGWVQL